MKPFFRNALLGAAGLAVLTLPAYAASSTTVADQPVAKATQQQLAQRPYDPSAGSVGFKKSNKAQQVAQRPYDPSAGSVGFKKSKKKKAKKK
jgi:curli biogenesis system outer membrane secretion channel CsgG